MDLDVTDPRPKAQQEIGPDGHPWHIDVRYDALDFQDSMSSAFGPYEIDHDATDSNNEKLVGQNSLHIDNWCYACPLCKQPECRPRRCNEQTHLVSRQGEWGLETRQELFAQHEQPYGPSVNTLEDHGSSVCPLCKQTGCQHSITTRKCTWSAGMENWF